MPFVLVPAWRDRLEPRRAAARAHRYAAQSHWSRPGARLAERLRPHRLDAVVSSDLARAWTTAQIVAEGLGIPLIREPGLRETHIGEAEGLFWPEVKSRFGEALTERWFTDDDAAFPGGETGT